MNTKQRLLLVIYFTLGLSLGATAHNSDSSVFIVANPLLQLAEYNVGEINQFDKKLIPENDGARFYQFGRNIAFSYDESLATSTERVDGNDEKVWSHIFFKRDESGNYFWRTDSKKGDTHTSEIALATDAPSEYKGKNNGDPCPPGWHIPTVYEANAFFPSNFEVGSFAGDGKKYLSIAERISIYGEEKEYEADYFAAKINVLYGIKFKGNGNKLLTAYKWSWLSGRGLEIKSRLLGESKQEITIEEIANESDFWGQDNEHDVVRFIPATGYIGGYYASAQNRGNEFYLMLNEPAISPNYYYSVWGYPYDAYTEEGGISYGSDFTGRITAVSIRCSCDNNISPEAVSGDWNNPKWSISINHSSGYIDILNAKAGSSVQIFNVKGLLIYNGNIHQDGSAHCDIGSLAEGSYFIRIENECRKIIVSNSQR